MKEKIFYTFGTNKLYPGPFEKFLRPKLLIFDPHPPCSFVLVSFFQIRTPASPLPVYPFMNIVHDTIKVSDMHCNFVKVEQCLTHFCFQFARARLLLPTRNC